MTRKKRIPIPDEIAAQVMFDSDSRCCKCHERKLSVQIHHIDENPANNDPDNLALLCLECHDETQVTGGFGRKLNAPLVRIYRDKWHATVKHRRDIEAGRVAAPSAPSTRRAAPRPRMSQDQARTHAERMRSLYETFYAGVIGLRDIASEMSTPPLNPNETWQQRNHRHLLMTGQAMRQIDSALPALRIEPGAKQVCEHYDSFRAHFNQITSTVASTQGKFSRLDSLLKRLSAADLNQEVDNIQQAIQDHLAQLDKHS
jgi:hypothetical protein